MKLKDACFLEEKLWPTWDSILKSRDIPLLTMIPIVKAVVFPAVMYRCECWIIKKPECQRIDAFQLWCWRRVLGVPWTSRRSNQLILKEMNPELSLEGLMLKLKFQYFCHLMWTVHWKRPWCGERWRQKEKGAMEDEMVECHHWLNGHEFEQTLADSEGQAWHASVHGGSKESDMI